ncbi:6997_t:CDS:1, partial [Gigaspora margarita]
TKRSKQDHTSFTSPKQFHETPTTLVDVQEIADDSESYHDDSHDDPQHDDPQHQHDNP